MRYHLESTLPIHAFNPLGGRHNPFKHGMTLEGGGDPISGAIKGIGDAFSGIVKSIDSNLVGLDKAVGNTIPGGWATVAAIAVPYAAPYLTTGAALTAGQAAALSAGTRAVTGAIQGEDPEDILKGAALSAAGSYGLSSLGGSDVARDFDYVPEVARDFDYIPESVPLETAIQTSPEPAVPRDFDTTDIPSSDVPSRDFDTTEAPFRDFDVGTFGEIPPETFVPRDFDYVPSTSPEILASTTPTLTEEKLKEDFFKKLLNASPSRDFDYVETLSRDFDYVPEGVQFFDRSTPASAATQQMVDTGYLDRLSELPGAAYDMAKSYVVANPYKSAALGIGALSLANAGDAQQQPQNQPQPTKRKYSYGSSRAVADPYLIKNTANARNIYGYRPTERYAEGGEVKHFGVGGLSNALTRVFQPIEKAVIQPIGQAVPFLKDVAPYAGILAAPFIANPFAAAGVGALSSGFGRPGTGFNMKRALMGGIAAYGASTVGAGLEAAGTEPTKPLVDTLAESYAVPGTEVPASTVTPKGFFRDTDAMQRGVGNLLGSDSKAAAERFGTQAGTFKSGVPIVMGISGMSAIDEAQKMQEEADLSAGKGRQETADMLARIAASKERAKKAVLENPYMFAAGGTVDDESGSDDSSTNQGNLDKGLFGLGYAAGGIAKFAEGGTSGGIYPDKTFSPAQIASYFSTHGIDTPSEINHVKSLFNLSSEQVNEAKGLIASGDRSIAEANTNYANAIAARPSAVAENASAVVNQLYSQQLGRAPDAEGLKYWTGQLASGKSPAEVAQALNRSLEGQVHETQAIESAYRQNLQRTAEQEGFQYWQSVAQSQGLTTQQLIDKIASEAAREQTQRGITPGTKFTEMQLASLSADPSGGRRPTTSIYDLPADVADRVNVSYIDGVPVQFVTPLTSRPFKSVFQDGAANAFPSYTGTAGDFVMDVPLINEYLTRQMDAGALNVDQYKQISNVLSDPTKTAEDRIAALSAPKSNVIIDPKYGLQIGEDVNLAKARLEAGQRQGVLNANDTGYYQSGDVLAQAYQNAGLNYPFMPGTYQANTMMTQADLLTPENIAAKSREFAESNPYLISNAVNAQNVYQYNRPQAPGIQNALQLSSQVAPQDAAVPVTGMAQGGIARFLSGGGDGMSDSIKANIEGTQEARLADGEFVIPADVVSHLGNGSSKAGAKQLYSMMDRVRKARTGNEKQGRQINPMKMMPA